jgi:hypothetical protein
MIVCIDTNIVIYLIEGDPSWTAKPVTCRCRSGVAGAPRAQGA